MGTAACPSPTNSQEVENLERCRFRVVVEIRAESMRDAWLAADLAREALSEYDPEEHCVQERNTYWMDRERPTEAIA